jgi:cytochrome c-type biogenesis protein CcmE
MKLMLLTQVLFQILFSEGKGVVAEGFLKDRNFFEASKILAKHDENYMPPEVKAALEEK